MFNWKLLIGLLLAVSITGLILLAVSRRNPAPLLKWHSMFLLGGISGPAVKDYWLLNDDSILTFGLMSEVKLRHRNGQVFYSFQPYEVNELPWHVAVSKSGLLCIGTNKNHIYVVDSTGRLLWRKAVPGTRVWTCVPAFGPGDEIFVGSSEGVVWSFDVKGNKRWKGDFAGISGITPITAANDGTVYGVGRDLSITAISNEGKQLWRSDPRVAGLAAPFVAPDGGPTCVDTLSGAVRHFSPDGEMLWEYHYQPGSAIRNEPVIDAHGVVVVNANINMENRIAAVSADGHELWSLPCGTLFNTLGLDGKGRLWMIDSDPHSARGKPGGGFPNLTNKAPRGYLFVIDPDTGKLLGRTRTPFYFSLTDGLARLGDSMVALGENGELYCYELP